MEGAARKIRSPVSFIALVLFLAIFALPMSLGVAWFLLPSDDSISLDTGVPQPGPVTNGPIHVPEKLIPVYEDAGQKYGVTWTVLAAIHYIETDFSMGNAPTSSAGAEGPMQFEPSTWAEYAVTAPGESGPPDIQNVYDAIYTAAHFLAANGFEQNPYQAIYAYNHADWYVQKVLKIADEIGTLAVDVSQSPLGQQVYQTIINEALKYEGYPYVFGGDNPQTSFDCSGLVQWVFGKAGIHLPRTAQEQYDATEHISQSQAKPGDLVFFTGTYEAPDTVTHVGIYVGNNMMYDADNSGIGYHVLSGYWMDHLYGFGRVQQ